MTVVGKGSRGSGGGIGSGLSEVDCSSNHDTIEAIPGCIRGIRVERPVCDKRTAEINPGHDRNNQAGNDGIIGLDHEISCKGAFLTVGVEAEIDIDRSATGNTGEGSN